MLLQSFMTLALDMWGDNCVYFGMSHVNVICIRHHCSSYVLHDVPACACNCRNQGTILIISELSAEIHGNSIHAPTEFIIWHDFEIFLLRFDF